MLIAAHALSLGIVLVSDNLREFKHVAGLKVENWREVSSPRQQVAHKKTRGALSRPPVSR